MSRARRIELFKGLARVFGKDRAVLVAGQWREALANRPELVADLAVLGFMADSAARLRAGRPAPLPADELAFREGARQAVQAILDRAGLGWEDVQQALEDLDADQ